MPNVKQELLSKFELSRKSKESEQAFLDRVARAGDGLDDDEFSKLSSPAQGWIKDSVRRILEGKNIQPLPGGETKAVSAGKTPPPKDEPKEKEESEETSLVEPEAESPKEEQSKPVAKATERKEGTTEMSAKTNSKPKVNGPVKRAVPVKSAVKAKAAPVKASVAKKTAPTNKARKLAGGAKVKVPREGTLRGRLVALLKATPTTLEAAAKQLKLKPSRVSNIIGNLHKQCGYGVERGEDGRIKLTG